MNSSHQFQIQYLRTQNMQRILESICIFIAALFVSAILPSLIVRYVYAGQALFEQPPILDVIPVVAFVVAVGYFLFAVVGNLLREKKIMQLEREMMGEMPRTASASVSDLQAAMTRVERSSEKSVRGKRTSRRR